MSVLTLVVTVQRNDFLTAAGFTVRNKWAVFSLQSVTALATPGCSYSFCSDATCVSGFDSSSNSSSGPVSAFQYLTLRATILFFDAWFWASILVLGLFLSWVHVLVFSTWHCFPVFCCWWVWYLKMVNLVEEPAAVWPLRTCRGSHTPKTLPIRTPLETIWPPWSEAAPAAKCWERQVSDLYPRYWQVKMDRWEFQVSAHAVNREETIRTWRRLEPFTFNRTETHTYTHFVEVGSCSGWLLVNSMSDVPLSYLHSYPLCPPQGFGTTFSHVDLFGELCSSWEHHKWAGSQSWIQVDQNHSEEVVQCSLEQQTGYQHLHCMRKVWGSSDAPACAGHPPACGSKCHPQCCGLPGEQHLRQRRQQNHTYSQCCICHWPKPGDIWISGGQEATEQTDAHHGQSIPALPPLTQGTQELIQLQLHAATYSNVTLMMPPQIVTWLVITREAPPHQLTTIGFIRRVRTVHHSVTLTVTMDTTSCVTLELTSCTWNYSQTISAISAIVKYQYSWKQQSLRLQRSPGDPRSTPALKMALNPRP